MKYRITKKYTFEAAHKLSSCYSESCKNIHGHSYVAEITLESTILNDDGMVIDFGKLDVIVKPIIKFFDHNYLTKEKIGYNPTAENMAKDILEQISKKTNLVYSVKLWETAKAFCEVFK